MTGYALIEPLQYLSTCSPRYYTIMFFKNQYLKSKNIFYYRKSSFFSSKLLKSTALYVKISSVRPFFTQLGGKMKKTCDFHTHSIYSDGSLTPDELVKASINAGLSAVALTDHNTVSGLSEFIASAEKHGIVGVPGVEFSTEYNDRELHILALFVRPEHFSLITKFIGDFKQKKDDSNRQLVCALKNAGFDVDYESILRYTPDGYVNRAHIARELVLRGYVPSVEVAFSSLLSEKCGYYKPPHRNNAFETVKFIKSISAVSVLAHPLLQLSPEELDEFLSLAVPCGLCAMETQYVEYTPNQRKLSEALVEKHGILQSGGSDFHGDTKPLRRLGVGHGDLCIPFEFYEKLCSHNTFDALGDN